MDVFWCIEETAFFVSGGTAGFMPLWAIKKWKFIFTQLGGFQSTHFFVSLVQVSNLTVYIVFGGHMLLSLDNMLVPDRH